MSDSILPLVKSYEEFERFKPDLILWQTAAKEIVRRHGLPEQSLTLFPDGANIVLAYGDNRVIKIFVPVLRKQFKSEKAVLEHLQNKLSVKIPTIEYSGEIDGWPYIVMSRVEGVMLEKLWDTVSYENKISLIRELGALIREVHSIPADGLEAIDSHWNAFIQNQIDGCVGRHTAMGCHHP